MNIKQIVQNKVEDLMREKMETVGKEFVKGAVEKAFEQFNWEGALESAIASQIDDMMEDAVCDAAETVAEEVLL